VAVVGGEVILAEELAGILSLEQRLFPSAEEELAEKRRLLDSIVETRLLVREAYRQKLDQDSLIRAFEEFERPLFLIDALYFREVRDKVRLTQSEIMRYYRALQKDRCFRQILTPQRALVDSLLRLLRQGARFDSLALAYSEDPSSASRAGDIGCCGWARRAPDLLFDKTLAMKPGEIEGPFRLPEGWILVQCYEERPGKLPDLKVFEPELRNLVEPLRANQRSAELAGEVRKKLNFRVIDSAARFVNLKQRELSKVKGQAPGMLERFSIYLRTEELTTAERDMPLVTYDGGSITVGQYMERLQGSVPMNRMVLDSGETTRAVLFQLVFREAMANRALALGLDKDPEFSNRLKKAVETEMARLLQARMLSGIRPDTAAARAYFQAHSEEFVQPAAAHLFEINRPREAELLELKKGIQGKPQFMAGASQFTARAHLRPTGGELGWVEQHQFPELFAAASKMKPGQIAGPIELADGSFSLVYLEAKRPSRKQTYREVQEGLLRKLWGQALDSVFAGWMAEQKRKVTVTLYPEVLEKTVDRAYYAKLKDWQDKLKEGTG
jgi:parvulin-like peptidyl-prolyl isomerase